MHNLKGCDNIAIAEYEKYIVLVDTPGWKQAIRFTKSTKKFIRMDKIFASKTKLKSDKYKYLVQVPTDYAQAIEWVNQNGDIFW